MTLHADALATLRAWQPPADLPAQEALRARFVTHLEGADDGVWRASTPDHITAGAIVLDATGERVLLDLHGKAKRWFHFGGHCEPGDARLIDVGAREAREESGIEGLTLDPEVLHLDEHAVPFCGTHATVNHLDVRFLAVAPDGAEAVASDESVTVRWWPVDQLETVDPPLEAEMLTLIRLARERLASR